MTSQTFCSRLSSSQLLNWPQLKSPSSNPPKLLSAVSSVIKNPNLLVPAGLPAAVLTLSAPSDHRCCSAAPFADYQNRLFQDTRLCAICTQISKRYFTSPRWNQHLTHLSDAAFIFPHVKHTDSNYCERPPILVSRQRLWSFMSLNHSTQNSFLTPPHSLVWAEALYTGVYILFLCFPLNLTTCEILR